MTLYATNAVSDAFTATRALLWPIDWRRWAKLTLVVLFVGGPGGGSAFNIPGGSAGSSDSGAGNATSRSLPEMPDLSPEIGFAIGGIIVAVLGLFLAFRVIGAVMEFVFVASLRDEAVNIRETWGANWRRGARLFGFRLAFLLVAFVLLGTLAALVILPYLGGVPVDGVLPLVGIIVLLPMLFFLALLAAIVNGLTTAFVVPIMLREERGIIGSWKRFWQTLRDQWKQFGAYVLIHLGLSIAAGMVGSLATVFALVVLAIPLGLLAALALGFFAVAEPVGIAVGALVAIVAIVAILSVIALIQVPIKTYLRYYDLLVLGDANDDFDLIPERRAAVREAATTAE